MRFGGLTRQLSDELKLAVRAKLMASEWSLQTQQAFLINRIVVWLATRHPATTSLLDRPLERWMVALQDISLNKGFCVSRCDDSSVGHRKRLARHYATRRS
jgi:hypothetical protein